MKPKEYAVYVSYTDNRDRPMFMRCGPADTLKQAYKLIEGEKRSFNDTFGGLIDPPHMRDRKYHIFHALWTEVE